MRRWTARYVRLRAVAALLLCAEPGLVTAAGGVAAYEVVGDAIPASLTGRPGDPVRGRAIVTDRTRGLCLLCHSGPFPDVPFQGTLSPGLAGAGSRHSAGQLRLRIVDGRLIDPATIMPAYHSLEGLDRVGTAWAGRPLLQPDEVEDVVAFLTTLKE